MTSVPEATRLYSANNKNTAFFINIGHKQTSELSSGAVDCDVSHNICFATYLLKQRLIETFLLRHLAFTNAH